MANSRKAIRDALVTMLSGETEAGTNVYANRETGLWQSELPAILVYTEQESAEPRDLSSRKYIRTLQLRVELKAEANSTVDDDLDDLAEEVEDIIDADQSITGTVLSTVLTNTELSVDADGEKEIGVCILNFECKYIDS